MDELISGPKPTLVCIIIQSCIPVVACIVILLTVTSVLTSAELSALSTLPYLTHLNVSNNKLTSVLDFNPPKNLLVIHHS